VDYEDSAKAALADWVKMHRVRIALERNRESRMVYICFGVVGYAMLAAISWISGLYQPILIGIGVGVYGYRKISYAFTLCPHCVMMTPSMANLIKKDTEFINALDWESINQLKRFRNRADQPLDPKNWRSLVEAALSEVDKLRSFPAFSEWDFLELVQKRMEAAKKNFEAQT